MKDVGVKQRKGGLVVEGGVCSEQLLVLQHEHCAGTSHTLPVLSPTGPSVDLLRRPALGARRRAPAVSPPERPVSS